MLSSSALVHEAIEADQADPDGPEPPKPPPLNRRQRRTAHKQMQRSVTKALATSASPTHGDNNMNTPSRRVTIPHPLAKALKAQPVGLTYAMMRGTATQ